MNRARRRLDRGAALMCLALAPAVAVIAVFRVYPLLRSAVAAAAVLLSAAWGPVRRAWGYQVLSGLAELALAAGAGLGVATLARDRGRMRGAAVTVALLPSFIPQTVLTAVVMRALGVGAGHGGPAAGLIAIFTGALGCGGFAAAAGVAWSDPAPDGSTPGSGVLRGVLLVVLARASLLLVHDADAVMTLSTQVMRPVVPAPYALIWPGSGMGRESVGAAAAVWVVEFAVQLVGVILLARIGGAVLAKRRERGGGAATRLVGEAGGIVWLLVVAAVVGYLVLVPLVDARNAAALLARHLRGVSVGFTFIQFGLVNLVSSTIAVFFVLCATYLLSRCERPGRRALYACLLVLLSAAPAGVHDYLTYRQLSMLNTFYPFLIGGLTPAFLVLVLDVVKRDTVVPVLHDIDHEEPFRFFQGFVRPLLPAALGLWLCHFCTAWNTVGTAGIFMVSRASGYPPAALFRALVPTAGVDSGVLLLGLLVSVVPVGMLLVVRRFAHPRSILGGVRW